jgi:hypothetical protein
MADTRSLLEVLAGLERLYGSMHNDVPPAVPSGRTIGKLIATVAKLSQVKIARPSKCPPDYVALWNKVGSSGSTELTPKAVRYLSWETEVAILPAFQSIALKPERITTRSLQGLVRSVHRRWDSAVKSPSVGNLAAAITTYETKSALLEKWKHGLRYVLDQNGPEYFAKDILRDGFPWETCANAWALEPDTEFGNQVLESCVAQSVKHSGSDAESLQAIVIREVLPSRHWRPSSFKTAVQQLILACTRSSQQHSERLKTLIQNDLRLLDPRLPANRSNWVGISDSARDLVIQWLSAEDIQLFFDHVLPTRDDPHGRKPFWLKYKNKVKRSRPLLDFLDESRWQANAATKGKRNFGRMENNCNTSAFLLDFGSVIVVEFSKYGNAVFLYANRDVPDLMEDFWSAHRFAIKDLKQPENCVDRKGISHNVLWQSKMRTLLAQFGIHP